MSKCITGGARVRWTETDEPTVCIACCLHNDAQVMAVSTEEAPWVGHPIGWWCFSLHQQAVQHTNTTFDHSVRAVCLEG